MTDILRSPSQGPVVWITGLSGSGKSTISKAVRAMLLGEGGDCILLDGDAVRAAIADPNTGYDRESRLNNAYRISRFAKLLADQDILVVVATISLFHEIHDWNRAHFDTYREVLIEVPADILKSRQPSALYGGANSAPAENVMGLSIPPEMPKDPHLTIDNTTDRDDFSEIARRILDLLPSRPGSILGS